MARPIDRRTRVTYHRPGPVHLNNWIVEGNEVNQLEFDPGSGRTLAVRLTHASRTAPV